MATDQITKDNAYDAADPDDFKVMLESSRYGRRSTAFDKIIAATHDHFWDPLDPRYVDFGQSFDLARDRIMPETMLAELMLPSIKALPSDQQIALANELARWYMSSILHGEQGALALSASLCHILKDPGAQEYAANQAREEARHVTAFSAYIASRWGTPLPPGQALADLLQELVSAKEVYKKIVGMQMLVEGLAMGVFAAVHVGSADPVLVRLTQLVMTDEAFHHKFGKIWADRTIAELNEQEQESIEVWAAECFQTILFNLFSPEQKSAVYAKFGLDWQVLQAETLAAFGDDAQREEMKKSASVFRVLVKTLLKSGIITDRTRSFYSMYVDLDELQQEGERMIGDVIAESGMAYLKTINFKESMFVAGGEAA